MKYGMKLIVNSQTSTVQQLKFGKGYVISSHTLLLQEEYPDFAGEYHACWCTGS